MRKNKKVFEISRNNNRIPFPTTVTFENVSVCGGFLQIKVKLQSS